MIPDNRRYLYYPLAQALLFHRKRKGISCETLARALGVEGVSRHSLCRYEKATQAPSFATLVALAKFYGLPAKAFAELLIEDDREPVGMSPQEVQQMRWQLEASLTDRVHKLPFPAVRKLLDYTAMLELHYDFLQREEDLK